MHSIYARINNVSALLSTCLMCLLGAIAVSSYLFTADPKGGLDVASIQVFPGNARRYVNKNQDFAFVNFNVSADLTPLFNWNTKQLFLYVSAEYTNPQGIRNDVVIWDKIVRRKEDANISIAGRNKYVFRELSSSFRSDSHMLACLKPHHEWFKFFYNISFKNIPPANYSLKYNVMPYVGVLTYGEAARTKEPVAFPESRDLS